MIKLYFVDYLIIGLYLYYFIFMYIKSIKKSMSICDKHNVWKCVQCEIESESES